MLTYRLKAIVTMVPESETVADIGCDHGKVAVWLLKNGRAKNAICGDLSGHSLDKARRLEISKGFQSAVSMREGSGFSVVEKGEADTAVVAGMGGELITSILQDGKDKLPDTLVLSCNKGSGVLRKWITENGFVIEAEDLVLENKHYYPVLRAVRGQSQPLSDLELEFGPVLLEQKPKLLKYYVDHRIDQTKAIRSKLVKTKATRKEELLLEIDERLQAYKEVMKCL
jgi:tRNA (adenine22-N1)-methyltransferase